MNGVLSVSMKKERMAQEFTLVGRVLMALSLTLLLGLFFTNRPGVLHANGEALTDLFYTSAFTGSWEWFSKVNFLGKLMNGIISIFCFLGLFLTIFRIVVTMLYLTGRNLFDTINDLKSHGKGQSMFGFPGMVKEVYNANYGVGLDAFFGFLLSLAPNVKAYSDYADGNMSYNLAEDDTITTYLLKISLPTIMTLFVFTIGFSGVLWQAFGNVVGALNVAMETLVNIQLDQYVNRALNTGSSYSFGFSGDDSEYGGFCQKIAKNVYNKVLSKTTDLTSESKLAIGEKVDTFVKSQVQDAKGAIDSTCGTNVSGNDKEAKNLQYSVVLNSTKTYSPSEKVFYKTIAASDLGMGTTSAGEGGDKGLYVHIFISKKASTDETNYFEFNGKSGKTGDTGDGPTQQSGDVLKQ